MLRNLIRLAIVLLVANALYQFVPVYVHYQQFKDAVEETALFSKDRTDAEIVDRVMALAERYQIPIKPEDVQVTRDKQLTYINVLYEEQVEWVPSYRRPVPFTVAVEGWHTKPPSRADAFE